MRFQLEAPSVGKFCNSFQNFGIEFLQFYFYKYRDCLILLLSFIFEIFIFEMSKSFAGHPGITLEVTMNLVLIPDPLSISLLFRHRCCPAFLFKVEVVKFFLKTSQLIIVFFFCKIGFFFKLKKKVSFLFITYEDLNKSIYVMPFSGYFFPDTLNMVSDFFMHRRPLV